MDIILERTKELCFQYVEFACVEQVVLESCSRRNAVLTVLYGSIIETVSRRYFAMFTITLQSKSVVVANEHVANILVNSPSLIKRVLSGNKMCQFTQRSNVSHNFVEAWSQQATDKYAANGWHVQELAYLGTYVECSKCGASIMPQEAENFGMCLDCRINVEEQRFEGNGIAICPDCGESVIDSPCRCYTEVDMGLPENREE